VQILHQSGIFNSLTGAATISGTYTCSNGDFIDVLVDARQNVGRVTILGSGEFFDFRKCDGTARKWSANVIPQNGKFAGGKTMTVSFATSCGPFECSFGYAEQKVLLSNRKK
jgi:hypothetical protein